MGVYEDYLKKLKELKGLPESIDPIIDPTIGVEKVFTEEELKMIDAYTPEETLEEKLSAEPEYYSRMRAEYRELKSRYNKLHRMLVKYEAGTLNFTPNCPVDILKRQAAAMGEYLFVLEMRIEIENIDL